ncbi:hypothetical protein AA313_de0203282 [Arthrobotrys entomopaga]|nr:hypothetical protein AA313_de0203282 [Arthrobotrys entomopaga]
MSTLYPPIDPEAMSTEQTANYNYMDEVVTRFVAGCFTHKDPETGAHLGIWQHFMHFPSSTFMAYDSLAASLRAHKDFPVKCREVAVLAIGEHYGAQFILYSHTRVANSLGFSDTQIEDLLNGRTLSNGSEEEILTLEITRAMLGSRSNSTKGPLSKELREKAESAFGKVGAGALFHWIGFYIYTSILLNATAIPLPKGEAIWPLKKSTNA